MAHTKKVMSYVTVYSRPSNLEQSISAMLNGIFSGKKLWLRPFLVIFIVAVVEPAIADNLTISDSQTSGVSTATGDGNGPGNIIVDGDGSIELTTGVPVTINSNNTLSNLSTIAVEAEADTTGVLIDLNAQPILDSGISNIGTITVPGPPDDSALIGTPVENAGIRMIGTGTFNGSIDNAAGASIIVGGNASTGISVGNMIGNITNDGTVSTNGIESTSIGIYGDLVGNITNNKNIIASGRDSIGLYVGGSVTGTITQNSGISSGRNATRDFDGKIVPEVVGDAAVWIAGSVSGGFQITGNQVSEAGELELTSDDPALSIIDAELTVIGSGQAVRVRPGGPGGTLADITMGVVGSGDNAFAILNQGVISTGANVEGSDAEAVTIEGLVSSGTVYSATLTGGLRNDGGDIRAGTTDGTATTLRIGNYGSVPTILNSGDILAVTLDSGEDTETNVISELGGNAFAIIVEEQGSLSSVINTGTIQADAAGSGSSAGAIIDRSGSITSFSNTGDVLATIRDGSTGTSTALDVRTSVSDISFFNSGTITGDIYLGDGSDTFTMTGGAITGDITLAGGNDVVSISDATVLGSFLFTTGNKTASILNSTLNGGIIENGAIIDLSLSNTDWTVTAGEAATMRTLDVQGSSTLRVEVDGVNNRAGTVLVTGTATLSDTTTIVPVLVNVISDQQRFTLVRAGQLNANLVFDAARIAETSYMHTVGLVLDPNDPNAIFLDVTRRSAADLGLSENAGLYYDASSTALGTDSALFTNLASITEQASFENALTQFLPDTSNAVMQAAINQQNMALGAITRRLDRVPAVGFYKDRPTLWLQTMGNYSKQKAKGERPGYTSWSGGVAIGTDRQVNEITRAGLAFTQLWSFPDELSSLDKPTEYSSSQLNGYFRMGNSYKHLQGAVTFGYDSFNSERRVLFGAIDRTARGNYNGYEFATAWKLALGYKRGNFRLIPAATLNYLYMHQGSFIETGGGGGLNLDVPENNRDSLRAGLGLAGRQEFMLEDESILQLELRTNYTREFMSGTGNIDLGFAAGGAAFILNTAALTQNVISLGAGLFYKNDHATISFDYDGEKASGYTGHTGTVTVRFRF
jgi:uncharacterized protein with beta-barrel porin domain